MFAVVLTANSVRPFPHVKAKGRAPRLARPADGIGEKRLLDQIQISSSRWLSTRRPLGLVVQFCAVAELYWRTTEPSTRPGGDPVGAALMSMKAILLFTAMSSLLSVKRPSFTCTRDVV